MYEFVWEMESELAVCPWMGDLIFLDHFLKNEVGIAWFWDLSVHGDYEIIHQTFHVCPQSAQYGAEQW